MTWHIQFLYQVNVSTTICIHSVMVFKFHPWPRKNGSTQCDVQIIHFGHWYLTLDGYSINIKVGPAWNLCHVLCKQSCIQAHATTTTPHVKCLFISAKLSGPQVRHPNQRVLANVARRRETRRPSSLTVCQHGPGSVPAWTQQDLH